MKLFKNKEHAKLVAVRFACNSLTVGENQQCAIFVLNGHVKSACAIGRGSIHLIIIRTERDILFATNVMANI